MCWIPFFTLTLVLSIMQTAKSDGPKDSEAIQGTWLASAAELGRKPFPEEVRKSIKLTLKDGKYRVTVGKNPDQGTVRLDPSAMPKAWTSPARKARTRGKRS